MPYRFTLSSSLHDDKADTSVNGACVSTRLCKFLHDDRGLISVICVLDRSNVRRLVQWERAMMDETLVLPHFRLGSISQKQKNQQSKD